MFGLAAAACILFKICLHSLGRFNSEIFKFHHHTTWNVFGAVINKWANILDYPNTINLVIKSLDVNISTMMWEWTYIYIYISGNLINIL